MIATRWNPGAPIVRSESFHHAGGISVEVTFDETGDHSAVHLIGPSCKVKLFPVHALMLANQIQQAANRAMGDTPKPPVSVAENLTPSPA